MTKATFERAGSYHSLYCADHTDPTVCAGVSALIQTLAGYLRNHRYQLNELHIKIESGRSGITFESADERADAVFTAVLIGFLQIEKGYPDHLRVTDNT